MAYGEILSALDDPTRRRILELLRDAPLPVGELARQLPVSRPAVSQHLKVLAAVRLVEARAEGTRRVYQICPEGLEPLRAWSADQDVTVCVNSTGVKLLTAQFRQSIDSDKAKIKDDLGAQFIGGFYETVEGYIQTVEKGVTHAALGGRLDDAGNLRLEARALFVKGSALAETGAKVKLLSGGPLAELPRGELVMAAGDISVRPSQDSYVQR